MRPNTAELKVELNCLIGQLQPLVDANPESLLVDLRRALMSFRDKLIDVPTNLASDRLQDFEERIAGDLAEDLHRLGDVSTPAPIALAELPPALRERYISKSGKWLLQVFAKDCLWDFEPLEDFAKQIRTVDPDATGKPFATVEGLRSMKHGFQWAGLYAFLAIVVYQSSSLLAILFTSILGQILTWGVLAIAGIVFPFRRREMYRQFSPTTREIVSRSNGLASSRSECSSANERNSGSSEDMHSPCSRTPGFLRHTSNNRSSCRQSMP